MPTVAVTSVGIQLPVNTEHPFNGTSVSGGGNLYVSRSPGVNAGNAEKTVNSFGSFNYPQGDNPYSLYVATDPGITVELTYSNDGSTLTPGVTQAVSANLPQLITSVDLAFTGANNTFPRTSETGIDISAYASIIFVLSLQTPVALAPASNGSGTAVNPWPYIQLIVTESENGGTYSLAPFASADGVNYFAEYLPSSYGPGGGAASFGASSLQIPVERPLMGFILQLTNASGSAMLTGGNMHVDIYGTGETINSPKYISKGNGFYGNIPEEGVAILPGQGSGQVNSVILASKNGPYTLLLTQPNAATDAEVELNVIKEGQAFLTHLLHIPTSGTLAQSDQSTGLAPTLPLQMLTVGTGTSPTGVNGVTQQ